MKTKTLTFLLLLLSLTGAESLTAKATGAWGEVVVPTGLRPSYKPPVSEGPPAPPEQDDNKTVGKKESTSTLKPTLKIDAELRSIESVNGKLNITSGHMKTLVHYQQGAPVKLAVTVDEFFPRYAEVDFGLNFKKTDLVWEDTNAPYIDREGYAHHSFRQWYRTSPTSSVIVPVAGTGAILMETADTAKPVPGVISSAILQKGRVVYFTQNFVRGLDKVITTTTPKISKSEAYQIAKKELGILTVTPNEQAPQMSLLPIAGLEVEQREMETAPPADTPPVDNPVPSGGSRTNGMLIPINSDPNLIIGFKGSHVTENAVLMWQFTEDLGKQEVNVSMNTDEGVFTVWIDAMTGKVVGKTDNRDYSDTPEGFFGKNVKSTGIPYKFYGTDAPINFTANERDVIQGMDPYYLMCQKTDSQTPPEVACAASFVMVKMTGPKKTEYITSPKNNFDSSDQKVPVSIFSSLQQVSSYFLELFDWSGFRDVPDDKILAYIGKAINSATNAPTSLYQPVTGGGPGYLFFDGFGNETLTAIASMDVVGHEYFHGIFRSTKDSKQEGVGMEMLFINEALADFFGKIIEFKYKPNPQSAWKVGAQLFKESGANGFIRDLENPKNSKNFKGLKEPLPDTYQGYYYVIGEGCPEGGNCFRNSDSSNSYKSCYEKDGYCNRSHRNSLVVSHMLQLLSDGTGDKTITNDLGHQVQIEGIGRTSTADIAWKALSKLSSDSTLRDFCTKAIDSAKVKAAKKATDDPDNIKSIVVKSTQDACFAVGLSERYEKRDYWPSEEWLGDSLEVDPWQTTLTWQVFPEKDENLWFVEVGNFPLNENFITGSKTKYEIKNKVVKEKFNKNGEFFAIANFDLSPDTPYWWHICPAKDEKEIDSSKKAEPGNSLQNQATCSEWREMQTFNTKKKFSNPTFPNGKIDYTDKPVLFQWTKADGAKDYIFSTYKRNKDGTAGEAYKAPYPTNSDAPSVSVEDAGTIPGGLCWSITPEGTNGSFGDESEKVCYQITPATPIPTKPNLTIYYPKENDLVDFEWEKAGGATSYKVNICKRPGQFQLCNQWFTELTTDFPNLQADYTIDNLYGYCWQVIGVSPDGLEGKPSETKCYNIDTQPYLKFPCGQTLDYGQKETKFTWDPPNSGASKYEIDIQLAGQPWQSFPTDNPVFTTDFATTNPNGGSWKVRALLGPNLKPGQYSDECHWTILAPAMPEIVFPPKDGYVVPYDPATKNFHMTIQWTGNAPHGYVVSRSDYSEVSLQGYFKDKCKVDSTVSCVNGFPLDAPAYIPTNAQEQPWNSNDQKQSSFIQIGILKADHTIAALSPIVHFSTAAFQCGNGIPEPNEQCDDGNATNGDKCDSNCKFAGCGSGIVTGAEECDDGNQNNNDSCKNDCKLNFCGDGVPGGAQEQCDHGKDKNGAPGDSCDVNCKLTCGNGNLDQGEECDDGNANNGDACEKDCKKPTCGNGIKDSNEQCDGSGATCPSGTTGTPTCSAQCTLDTSSCKKQETACNPPTLALQNVQPVSSPEPYKDGEYWVVPSSVELTWSGVPGAAGYDIEYYIEGNPNIAHPCKVGYTTPDGKSYTTNVPSYYLSNCQAGFLTKGWKYLVLVKPKGCGQYGPGAVLGIQIE